MQHDLVFASHANRAIGQANFAALYSMAHCSQRFANIDRPDRAKQFAFRANPAGHGNHQSGQLPGPCTGLVQFGIGLVLQLRAQRLHPRDVLAGRQQRLALWQQVIAPVTRFDLDLIANFTQILDFFQQY